MDESVIKHLEQPQVGTLKLSDAIRIGRPMITREDKNNYRLCAIGCAWAGVRGRVMTEAEHLTYILAESCNTVAETIAKELGFPPDIARQVSVRHFHGESALSIADWLESQGY